MIYTIPQTEIPQESRKEINSKILHLIETGDLQGLTHQDIYEAYSGDGGLHGLSFNNFKSFHEYTEAKKEVENGQFFTPPLTACQMAQVMQIKKHDIVADLTCGNGAFFNFLPQQSNVYGCDIDRKATRVAKFLYPKANIECCDIRDYKVDVKFDHVIGNPPFNLDFGGMSSQRYFCQKAHEMMVEGGILGFIVPKSFMNDEMMNKSDINFMNEHFSFIGQYELSPKEFKAMGVKHFETKVMFFQKLSEHITKVEFNNVFTQKNVIEQYITECLEQKRRLIGKITIESEQENFEYKVRKYLYEFKQHDNLKHYLPKAKALIVKFQTQKIPEGMEWKEWKKIRLTENKVLSTFKRVMKNAYKVEKDITRLVKTNYTFEIKTYSAKQNTLVNRKTKVRSMSIVEMIIDKGTRDAFKRICVRLGLNTSEMDKVLAKRLKMHSIMSTPIADLKHDVKINNWLRRTKFVNNDMKKYNLHATQRKDLNAVCQRDHTLLAWSMGVGKTIALFTYYKFIKDKVKNVFVTAPAISVQLTLKPFFDRNNVKYIEITHKNQIKDIKEGQLVIMTLTRVSKAKKELQQFMKTRSNKVALLFDESDEITNYSSKRTKAIIAAFRRCKKSLLMTGTATRNNIIELYPNLELMYNNSYNMISTSSKVYRQDSKTKEIRAVDNPYRYEPFNAYHGFGLFRASFSPSKASVFGIQKQTQDVYNADELGSILKTSVITRTFEEICGKKFDYHTHLITPNPAEKELQRTILEEFHQMCYTYFKSTGNSRKESYLRIIRMINLLIKSTSTPHLFAEWTGQGLPTKYAKVMKMIEKRNEKVMVGCVGIPAAMDYFSKIKSQFPNREVFYVDGDVSFKKRDTILNAFEATENGILVANQAALKSSVNVPTCNEVIICGLAWNFSKLNQFIFRCIRFDSKENTNVHLIAYDESIELNILNLLLNKERVNNFIKTAEITEDEEVYNKYDVDSNMLGSLIQKHYDKDGGMHLSWSSMEVSA